MNAHPQAADPPKYEFGNLPLPGRGPVEAIGNAEILPTVGTDSAPGLECLTPDEQSQREGCEQVMEEGLEKALAFALASSTIQRKRLYRNTHRTFALYMDQVWGVKVRQAYRELSRLETLKAINGIAADADSEDLDAAQFKIIAPESHTRPFYDLPREHRQEAWNDAVDTAPNGVMTGKWGTIVASRWKVKLGLSNPLSGSVEGQPGISNLKSQISEGDGESLAAPVPPVVKGEQVKEMANTVVKTVRLLRDTIGSADSSHAANVTVALELLENYRDHLGKLERMQAGRA